MHYDFAITCRPAIGPAATGVGLITRLLLQAHARAGLRCIVFGEEPPEPGFTSGCPHPVRHVRVDPPKKTVYDNLRTPELIYSHALFLRIDEVLRDHSIRLIEFPDVQAEGWMFIHHNLVYRRIPCVTVRLHGARFIIDEDNALRTTPLQTALIHAGEREAIQRADHVLYTGDALRERVLACYPPKESAALRNRCVLLPAPHPAASAPSSARAGGPVRHIGCIGPLEYRLGTDLFVLNAAHHFEAHPESPLQIHCLGPDTLTASGDSFLDYLRNLVPPAVASRFVIEAVPSGAALDARAASLDAFVFPARFASDPSLLTPVAALGAPVFVSGHGDLPAQATGLPGTRVFDPLGADTWPGVFAALEAAGRSTGPARGQPPVDLSAYSTLGDTPPPALRPVRLAVVTPHLNDADNLQSLLDRFAACPQRDRLEHFVVDDGSRPEVFARVEKMCAAHSAVTLLRTPHLRSGPFVARLVALGVATADFVAFVDSDDYIDTERYLHYASVLDRNSALDAILPAQRFFGGQNHEWLPGPKNRATVIGEPFAHIGLLARRTNLHNAFLHATSSAHLGMHGEDWMHACSLLFAGASITVVPEVGYYYNRGNPTARSRTRDFMHWQSKNMMLAHYERCLSEALADGTVPACDLHTIRRLSLTLGDTEAMRLAARGNKAPWHTHLFRAFRSLAGDRRYRP